MIEQTEAIGSDLSVGVLTRALNATPIVVEVASLDGCLAFVSDAWCNLFGHERREVIDTAWFDLPPLGTCHDLLESWRLCLSTGHSAGEAVVHLRAGSDMPLSLTRWVDTRGAGLRDMVVTIYARRAGTPKGAEDAGHAAWPAESDQSRRLGHDLRNQLCVVRTNALLLDRAITEPSLRHRISRIRDATGNCVALLSRLAD